MTCVDMTMFFYKHPQSHLDMIQQAYVIKQNITTEFCLLHCHGHGFKYAGIWVRKGLLMIAWLDTYTKKSQCFS